MVCGASVAGCLRIYARYYRGSGDKCLLCEELSAVFPVLNQLPGAKPHCTRDFGPSCMQLQTPLGAFQKPAFSPPDFVYLLRFGHFPGVCSSKHASTCVNMLRS